MRVLAHGCFEILHAGHYAHLLAASKLGELYVSVTADGYVNKGAGRPIFRVELRVTMLNAMKCVHSAFISNSENAVGSILGIKPDIYVKGFDYADGDPSGRLDLERAAVESIGGKMVILKTEPVYSSTKIVTGEYLRGRM